MSENINVKAVMSMFEVMQDKLREDARDIKAEQEHYNEIDNNNRIYQEGVWSGADKIRSQGHEIVRPFLKDEADPSLLLDKLARFITGEEKPDGNPKV